MSAKYVVLVLDQPWGEEEHNVRIFPPCEVKNRLNRSDTAVVFTKDTRSKNKWRRKLVENYWSFPDGFIAWDDKNQEYAWHDVGTIDVPSAEDPLVTRTVSVLPSRSISVSGCVPESTGFKPIIRGESETVGGKTKKPKPKKRNTKSRFVDWWTSKGSHAEPLDFLRESRQ